MKVTIVAHDVGGIGGMERQLEVLIHRLLERGADVIVVSRTLDLPGHAQLRWRRVRGPARPFVLAYPWFALIATLKLAREPRGVLHTTGAIVFNRADISTVHFVHNGKSRTVKRMRRTTYPYRLNAFFARAISRLGERIVYSRPTLSRNLVAVSEPLAVELRDAFPGRVDAIRVIENGVDTDAFRPDERARRDVREALDLDDAVRLALFVGSDWRRKGLDIAISALLLAPSWHLAVVGDGDANEASILAAQLGVASRVHYLAPTFEPERYYAAADAFVLPSAYESFSLAAFEAAACGVPVISTEVGAVGKIVEAGGGMFVERTENSVGNALAQLTEDPALAAVMGERARTAAERFDWDMAVRKYIDLYSRSEDKAPSPTSAPVTE